MHLHCVRSVGTLALSLFLFKTQRTLRRICPLVLVCPLLAGQSVTTQQYDNSRSGVQSQETVLTPANVSVTTFGKTFSLPVSGHVYAQPLYVQGLTMGDGALHNVLFVATEQDFVYAFDADGNNPVTGYLWRVSLAGPGETFVSHIDVNSGDVYPDIGVTGTPVIDASSNTFYVVAKSKTTSVPAVFHQRLHALNLVDGTEKLNGPTDIQGTVPGTGDGGTTVVFSPLLENQRAGLLLAPTPTGMSPASVFIAWASHGDSGPYHGWVASYSAADISQQTGLWCDTPNGKQGGIWLAGGALSSDNAGTIFGASGNGTFDAGSGGSNLGNSAFALWLNGSVLAPRSFFTPSAQDTLRIYDNDMGVSSMVLLPTQTGPIPHLAVSADKSGKIYLMNADALGGYDGATDASLQAITSGGYSIRTSASFFNNTLYLAPEAAPLSAWSFSPQTETLSTTPISSGKTSFGCADCGGAGSTPSISANGVGTAIVWTLDNSGREKTPSILHAYDATNLQTELYNSAQAATNRDVGAIAVKFTTPVVANGRVYVGGLDAVTAYGLIQPVSTVSLTAAPATIVAGASSTLTVAAGNATGVVISGSDGSSIALATNATSLVVHPAANTTYTATATGGTTTVTATATVTVIAPLKVTLLAVPSMVVAGVSSTLTVGVSNATSVVISGSDGSSTTLAANATSLVVHPSLTTTYTVTATGSGGTGTATATVAVASALRVSLTATPATVVAGASSTLSVLASGAAQVWIAGSDGSKYMLPAVGGSQVVRPLVTTIYVVTGSAGSATATASTTVSVTPVVASSCSRTIPGVTVCAPIAGARAASPLMLSAAAMATTGNITAIRAYLDNVATLTVMNPHATRNFLVNYPFSASVGVHRMVVLGYQSNGGVVQSVQTLIVTAPPVSGCVASAGAVNLCSPAIGARVTPTR